MASISFDIVLKDMDGSPLVERSMDAGGVIREVKATLGRIAANAILAVGDDDKNMPGAEKVRRYELAMRVIKGKVNITLDEVNEIKAAIGRHYAPLIVGQSWKLLDHKETKEK